MIQKHSAYINGRKTSFSLETEFWEEFKVLADKQNLNYSQLVTQIDQGRNGVNLSSALRVYILEQVISNGQVRSEHTQPAAEGTFNGPHAAG